MSDLKLTSANSLVCPSRDEWLERRREGIGGSDAAVILGLSRWKSPLQLYSEKIGLTEDDREMTDYLEWGQILEEPIAKHYREKTGRKLFNPGRHTIFRHPDPELSFIQATPDRFILPLEGGSPGSLSIKTAGAWKADEWEDEPSIEYQAQLQHELIVLGWTWGSFAVLIGGNKPVRLDVQRHDRFCDLLVEREYGFWERVQRREPPEADGSESSKEILGKLYPKDSGESVALPGEAFEWTAELEDLKSRGKECTARVNELENKLKQAVGEASVGILPDGSGWSWKKQTRAGFTVAPSEFRVLRRVKCRR